MILCLIAIVSGANVNEEEEVTWDDDSEDESESEDESDDESDSDSDSPSTPHVKSNKPNTTPLTAKGASSAPSPSKSTSTLKPNETRRSNDQQSQADSESSYDVVSGTTSRTPGSPKEKSPTNAKGDDSDEDWE